MSRVISLNPTNPKHSPLSRKFAHSKSVTSPLSSLPVRLPPLSLERNGTPLLPPAKHFLARKSSSFNSCVSTPAGRFLPRRNYKSCGSLGVLSRQCRTRCTPPQTTAPEHPLNRPRAQPLSLL